MRNKVVLLFVVSIPLIMLAIAIGPTLWIARTVLVTQPMRAPSR